MATIQKLHGSEYLKAYSNMNIVERAAFHERVKAWMERSVPMLMAKVDDQWSRLQNVIQVSVGWNHAECEAFREGSLLLTALIRDNEVAAQWLPDVLWVDSARSAVRALRRVLSRYTDIPSVAGAGSAQSQSERPTDTGAAERQEEQNGGMTERQNAGMQNAAIARPKHIDQYVHLLPESTQQKAAGLRELHDKLAEARDMLDRMIDDPHAAQQDLASLQKTVVSYEDAITKIYSELDVEWEKAVNNGDIVIDEFGVARKRPTPDLASPPQRSSASVAQDGLTFSQPADSFATRDGGEASSDSTVPSGFAARDSEKPKRHRATKAEMAERKKAEKEEKLKQMSEEEKAKRREYLKKWLRDTRTAKSPKHDEQWLENLNELVLLGGEITESIRNAAVHYKLKIEE